MNLLWPDRPDRSVGTVAIVFALVLALLIYVFPNYLQSKSKSLVCRRQNRSIFIDGKQRDIEWLGVDGITVPLHGGANLPGGETVVKMNLLRDNRTIYFLFQWNDQTRSLNKHLIKSETGWELEETAEKEQADETNYSEDQIAVTLDRNPRGCLPSCHLLPPPGIGRHYTAGDTVDFWSWKAVSSNPAMQAIDGYWDGQLDSRASGIHRENAAGGGYLLNLDEQWRQPFFLPRFFFVRDWLDITTDSYDPYVENIDTFSVGSRIPAIAVAPMMGDIADVRAFGRWRGGQWTLELARHMSTGSPLDVKMIDTLYMNIAVFDNAEKKHAYSIHPIRIIFE